MTDKLSREELEKKYAEFIELVDEERGETIYDRIGPVGLVKIVIKCTPLTLFPGMIYTIPAYKSILERTRNLQELLSEHSSKYRTSTAYRILRPRFSEASKILKNEHGIA